MGKKTKEAKSKSDSSALTPPTDFEILEGRCTSLFEQDAQLNKAISDILPKAFAHAGKQELTLNAFIAYCMNEHILEPTLVTLQEARLNYWGEFESDLEFARFWCEHEAWFNGLPQQYRPYFDMTIFTRDLMLSHERVPATMQTDFYFVGR